MNYLSKNILLILILSFSHSEIIMEQGSLEGFITSECSTCEYDNYLSHISEGIASPGYNIYAPDSIDVQSNGFGDYKIINSESETLVYWKEIFNHFINNNLSIVDQMLSDSTESFKYNIIEFEDTVFNKNYYMLRERLDTTYYDSNLVEIDDDDVLGSFSNGWGLYIINPEAINKQVVIEIPHPNDDFISPYVGLDLFFEIDAFALLLSGTGREVKWTNQGSYTNNKSLSDPSRNSNTIFHQFHEVLCDSLVNIGPHSPIVFHMHSFDENESHEGFKSLVISGGYDAKFINKPIRDISNEHIDIINLTDEFPIYENQFSFLGNHESLRVDEYYQVHYDSIFNYYGNEIYEIPHAYELLGPTGNNAVQMLYLRNYFDNVSVYEPWIQVELDEKPELFRLMNVDVMELYDNNYSIIRDYYKPFNDAVKSYLDYWNEYPDLTPPTTVNNLLTSFDGDHYVKLNWDQTNDSNFKSYSILYSQDSLFNDNYQVWDVNNQSNLVDVRTNEATIYNLNSNEEYYFTLKSIDHFNNESQNSNIVKNDFINHLDNIVIQNFETNDIILNSFPNHDQDPNDWEVDSLNTFYNSNGSLKLYGNTWKVEDIENQQINQGSVWQIASYSEETGEIIGLALQDSVNTLYYSFYGSQELDMEEWVTVYQGAFSENQWNIFQLPIADDWHAYFDYYPLIDKVVYINDKDDSSINSISYFDDLIDITNSIPYSPNVEIDYEILDSRSLFNRDRSITVNFYSYIEDEDSDNFSFSWHFGDGESSTDPNPTHNYVVQDNHIYNVILQVEDNQGYSGYATIPVAVEFGISSLPLTMNFVGDIMFGRNYENVGGIIDQYGVEYIFEHTLELLGNQADITVANLECPLTLYGEPHPTKSVVFKADPSSVSGLVYAGIDVVSLANNHIIDYGIEGLINTQEVLDENNILHSGAGLNSYEAYQPLIVNSHGLNIALLASSDRTGQYNNAQPYLNAGYNKPGFAYMTPYYLREQIRDVNDIADFIIIEMHAGSEYSTQPGQDYDQIILDNVELNNNYLLPNENINFMDIEDISDEEENYSPFIDVPHMWDREIRHFAIDNGADLVIVHHPHVIQGFEVYNEKLIAHSLGNFVFDLSYPETFPSLILNSSLDTSKIYNYNIDPIYIDERIPYVAQGELGLHILDYIAYKSSELNTYIDVNREDNKGYIIIDPDLVNETYITSKSAINTYMDNSEYYSIPIPIHKFGNFHSIDSLITNYEFRLGRDILWFGNMEDEGSTMWNLNNNDEYYDDSEYFNGARSICLSRDVSSGDNIITNLQYRIKMNDQLNYGLYGNIKTVNANDANVQVRYYSSRSSSISLGTDSFSNGLSGDNEWTTQYSDLSPRNGTNFFDTRLNLEIPESDSSKAFYDDISIIEWSDWHSTFDEANHLIPNDYYFIQIKSNEIIDLDYLIHKEVSYSELNPVTPNFSISQSDYTSPSAINFKNESSGLTGWFLWNFGDGSTSFEENPIHTYTSNGPFTVSLTVLDYNSNPLSRQIDNLISFNNVITNGDMNSDSTLNILDIVMMINLVLNQIDDFSGILNEIGDLDGNGDVDILDIVQLVNIILVN